MMIRGSFDFRGCIADTSVALRQPKTLIYVCNLNMNIGSSSQQCLLREAAKKVPPLVIRPLRGGGKAGPLRKKNFLKLKKKFRIKVKH